MIAALIEAPGPWLAYSVKCAASTNTGVLGGQPKDHATLDGVTTLCGMRDIGQSRETAFDPDGVYSCKHCVRKVAAEQTRREGAR